VDTAVWNTSLPPLLATHRTAAYIHTTAGQLQPSTNYIMMLKWLFSTSAYRKMRDFPGHFYRTLQDLSGFPVLSRSWNFREKIQDFPGGVGTL